MATNAGELEVTLKLIADDFKKSISGATDKIEGFQSSLASIGKAIGVAFSAKAILDFGRDAVRAYGEQEQALSRLTIAVGSDAAGALSKYAEELQKVTTFTDEGILALQTQLANFGLMPGTVKAATKPILDFAAATGKDLTEATNIFGQALAGNSRELKKYGLILEEGDSRADRLAKTTALLTEKFGGAAEQMAGTTIGSIENLKNRIGELQEKIGKELVPVVSAWVGWLNKAVGYVERITGASRNDLTVREMQIAQLKESNKLIGLALQGYSEYRNTLVQKMGAEALDDEFLRNRIIQNTNLLVQLQAKDAAEKASVVTLQQNAALKKGIIDNEVNAETKAWRQLAAAENAARDATVQHLAESIGMANSIVMTATEEQGKAWEEYYAKAHESQTIWRDMFVTTNTEMANKFTSITETMFNDFGRAMADVIVDSQNFSQAIKQVWKSLIKTLISEIVALIAKLAIALAFKSALGFGGASMGQVAASILGFQRLASKPMGESATGGIINEPSLLTGLKSGKTILAGEAGAEAIVPLGKSGSGGNMTAKEMGMDFTGAMDSGGLNLTVNISGQFIEGNENQWQRMFREKIMPEIRRMTMSNPTGNFIRRRGATA
jgi:hypothetical protein